MNLQELVDSVKNLPPGPQLIPKLLKALNSENEGAAQVAEIIRCDPALTAKVLALSNSAWYGGANCTSLEDAINRVGFREVYRLVGMVMSERLARKPVATYYLDEGQLWENSMGCALAMEKIARLTDQDLSLCYTAGLLHAIGKLVINEAASGSYEKVFELVETKKMSLNGAEREVLGFDHAQVGEALLIKWKFQPELCTAIAWQYDPLDAPDFHLLCCATHMANWIVAATGLNPGRDAWAMALRPEAVKKLGISEIDLQKIVLEVHTDFEELKKKLVAPNQSPAKG